MIKTATFKLHNVSQRKRAVLFKAMKNYHLLTSALLDKATENVEEFKKVCTFVDSKGNEKLVPRNAYEFCKKYKPLIDSFKLPSNLKTAARNEVGRMMCAYLSSSVEGKQPPTLAKWKSTQRIDEWESALTEFISCIELSEEEKLRDTTAREPTELRMLPLMFANINDNNNPGVSLFIHKPSETYRALLYVDNTEKTSRKPKFSIKEEQQLYSVKDGTQAIVRTAAAGILVPLEMGFYQLEEFLKRAIPKEGKLSYRADKDAFYLHLAFEFLPEKLEPRTIMGVDRGVTNICAYTVCDSRTYKPIESGHCEGKTLLDFLRKEDEYKVERQKNGHKYTGNRKRNFADRVIHLATNEVVLKAQQHCSQVYVEDLSSLVKKNQGKKEKGKRNRTGQLSALGYSLSKAQYSKFLSVLSYKLEAVGLPKPKDVGAAYTSTTCPECGTMDKLSRVSRGEFICVRCGYAADADVNAGRLIAIKGQWHWLPKADKKKIKGSYKGEDYMGLWSNMLQSIATI